jgi:hypothetical protein
MEVHYQNGALPATVIAPRVLTYPIEESATIQQTVPQTPHTGSCLCGAINCRINGPLGRENVSLIRPGSHELLQ